MRKDGLSWLDEEEHDDEVTRLEKKAIRKWLRQRHGVTHDTPPNHASHWLILPKDVVAGKQQDVEDLARTIKTLKAGLVGKDEQLGALKQKLAGKQQVNAGDADLLEKLKAQQPNLEERSIIYVN